MTQEFRTFTQRLTDEPNEKTRIFSVRAKTIVDRFGDDVVDVKGSKIWFPENFDPAAAIAFGRSLASEPTMNATQAFRRAVSHGATTGNRTPFLQACSLTLLPTPMDLSGPPLVSRRQPSWLVQARITYG
jgi:hypothetical protein